MFYLDAFLIVFPILDILAQTTNILVFDELNTKSFNFS